MAQTNTMDLPLAERFATSPSDRKVFVQSYQTLHIILAIAPLLAGIDKFFNLLTNWEQYLAPLATQITGFTPTGFMHIVGAVEIVAAIGVILKPKIFGYVVAVWLIGIIINLFILGNYFDVALRDLGLAVAAVVLARLAIIYEHGESENQTFALLRPSN